MTWADPVIALACERYGLTREAILGRGRSASVVHARQWAMWTSAQAYPEKSLSEIGRAFNRGHTSVANALRKIGGERH